MDAIFPVLLGNEKNYFLEIRFLAVGSSLRHLSIKKFSDLTYRLGPKIRQREYVLGKGW